MELSRHQRRMLLIQTIFLWENLLTRSPERAKTEGKDCLRYIWNELSEGSFDTDANDFDHERFTGMMEKIDQLKGYIRKYAPEWPLEKIASHDRAVLYLSIYELIFTDVPPAVVINEAVELAKDFGGDRSSQFINGVLSALNKKEKESSSKK